MQWSGTTDTTMSSSIGQAPTNIFAFLEVLLQEDIGNVLKVRSSEVQALICAKEKKEDAETDLKTSREKTKTISNLFLKPFVIYSIIFY